MLKYQLKIGGMACGMCEAHVNDAIRQSFAVKKVRSSHANGQCTVLTEQALNEDRLREVLHQTGYELLELQQSEVQSSGGLFSRFRKNR